MTRADPPVSEDTGLKIIEKGRVGDHRYSCKADDNELERGNSVEKA